MLNKKAYPHSPFRLKSLLNMGDNLFEIFLVAEREDRIAVINRYGKRDGTTRENQSEIPSITVFP
jgi:hypothetical protein